MPANVTYTCTKTTRHGQTVEVTAYNSRDTTVVRIELDGRQFGDSLALAEDWRHTPQSWANHEAKATVQYLNTLPAVWSPELEASDAEEFYARHLKPDMDKWLAARQEAK